jgi:hypothetical protein
MTTPFKFFWNFQDLKIAIGMSIVQEITDKNNFYFGHKNGEKGRKKVKNQNKPKEI